MCLISIEVPIRKKSGNLFNDSRVYIFTYMRVIHFKKRQNIFVQIFSTNVNSALFGIGLKQNLS